MEIKERVAYSDDSDLTVMAVEGTPQAESSEQSTEESQIIDYSEPIEDVLEPIPSQNFLARWMSFVTPLLNPGGKAVALILSLGVVSIPLAMTGNIWIAFILAVGATAVAIIVAVRSSEI